MNKKCVSWYVERPETDTKPNSEDEDSTGIVLRAVSGRRDQTKSSSLDPGQETQQTVQRQAVMNVFNYAIALHKKMSINLPRPKSPATAKGKPLYFTGPSEENVGSHSDWGVGSLPRSLPRSTSSYRIGKLNTQLLEAIETGDLEEITRLMKLGANPNATCRLNYVSACHMAAMINNDSLELLIQWGAKSFRTDKLGRTPFHLAAWAGNPKQLAVLLDLPEDLQNELVVQISSETEQKIRSLSSVQHPLTNLPCNIGDLSALPKKWSDSMEHNCRRIKENDRTIGFLGIQSPQAARVEKDVQYALKRVILTSVEQRANLRAIMFHDQCSPFPFNVVIVSEAELPLFKPGWTAMHSACARAQYTCVQLLLAAGADPNAQDLIARTPLDVLGIAHYSGQIIDVHNFKEILRIVLAAGGKFHSIHVNCLKKMNTPLHTAVQLESKDAIEELLKAGVSVNRLDNNGLTAMHICVEKRLKEHLQLLSNFEYDDADPYLATVDAKDQLGQTVLHAAVRAGWTDGVRVTLGAGASVSIKANDGDSPIHSAAELDDVHILQEIITVAKYAIDYRNQKGQTPIFVAIINNRLDIVKILIENGASISLVLPDHQNVIHIAAELGYVEILEYLLNYSGRNLASLLYGEAQNTPIMNAVVNNHPVCVHLLLSKFFELYWSVPFFDNMVKKKVFTSILHIAAAKNHYKIAKMITDFDSETINQLNDNGLVPLHEACIYGNRQIITLLVSRGADLSKQAEHPKIKHTPMEMIMNNLSKPVAYMEEVFDSYIYISHGRNIHDKECQITVEYNILMPNSGDGKQMKVLEALVNTGNTYDQRKLLHHPLIESFLYLKWKALVPFFYAIIALFGLFVLSLNVYVVSVFYYQDKNNQNITNSTNNIDVVFKIKPVPNYLHSDVWKYMIYFTVSLLTMQEIIFIKINKRRYLLLLETWVKFGVIILSMFLPCFVTWEGSESVAGATNPEWARLVATIALLLSWLELMILLSRFPSWGFYVLMFGKVASKVIKILLTFIFLIVGFSMCFMIQFRAKSPFEGPVASITKTLVMMTSEYDYMNMINKGNTRDIGASILLLRLIFITFVILTSIVLMNLMIGVAVNDVNNLEDIGKQKRLVKQVEFLKSLEDIVCHKIIKKIPSIKFKPFLSLTKKVMNKIVLRPRQETCNYSKILPRHIREAIFEKAQLQKKQMDDERNCKAYNMKFDDFQNEETGQSERANIKLIENINADIEELRNEILVIKDILLKRPSTQ